MLKTNRQKLSFEEVLERDKSFIYKTTGVSMLPMLRQNRDLVIISEKRGRLAKNDVALFKRENGQYVLHRVISLTDDGYIIRGDNCYGSENVGEERIIGVMTGFVRGKRQYSTQDAAYKCYVRVMNSAYPLRRFYIRVRGFLVKIKRKLLK